MKSVIKIIIIIILSIMLLLAVGMCGYMGSEKIYNHGICEKCGGHYEFADCGGGRFTVFVYKCDTCGYVIETSMLMNSED